MKIRIPDRLKSPTTWAAILGAAAGYLAHQLQLAQAISQVVEALTK